MWPASTGNVSIAMIISSPQTCVLSSHTPTVSPKSGPESSLYSSVLAVTFKPIETTCNINLAPSLLPLHLRQCSLRLGQPEDHVHGPVQRDGSRQFSARLLLLIGCGI